MPSATIDRLRAVNHSLRARLARLLGGHNRPAVIAPTEFTDLLSELLRASDGLRGMPTATAADAELASEISEYRRNVEQLGKILPSVQGRLLVEKVRLQTLQSHMTAAKAWAQASKETLWVEGKTTSLASAGTRDHKHGPSTTET